MAHLFQRKGSVNQPAQPAATLRVQQSIQGKPRPIGYGRNRIAGNLLWYGDFVAVQQSQGGGGGKGTGGGASGKGAQGSGTFSYYVSFILGLCEGPVTLLASLWNNKAKGTYNISGVAPTQPWGQGGTGLGISLFSGTYAQTAWGHVASLHPTEALNYRGDAYVASTMMLGNNPELPNLTFEMIFGINSAYPGTYDANPKTILADVLSSVYYGVGFPSARLDANTSWSNYCIAADLVMSPVLVDQRPLSDTLADWAVATNSEFVWSAGTLKVVPYGDQSITANGATYTAPSSPLYALTDADFLSGQDDGSPVIVNRNRIEDADNSIPVEYLDQTADYNPAIAEQQNDAAIQVYGLKRRAVLQLHGFTRAAPAQTCASLLLGRQQILNEYEFTVQGNFVLLEPMDIISIYDAGIGAIAQFVRIKEITENDDYSLTIVAEEYLNGTGNAPVYGIQPNSGFVPDYNVAPGAMNAPLIFEPTDQLAGGLEIWMALSANPTSSPNWGGAEIWVSTDGTNFALVGEVKGSARVGVSSASLATVTAFTNPPTIDTTNTLSIDFTSSGGQITSGTQDDALKFSSLLYVGGEYVGYRDVAVTGTYLFNASYLTRGGYGTTPATHASAVPVCRIDQSVFRYPFTQDRVGQTLYFKFLSFNKYGGALQALSDVGAVAYVVQGTALTSPLPDVQNFVSSFVGNITYFDWDNISDFRTPILYEIRKGVSWGGGQVVGQYAHPHVPAIGDATYWIKAFCQPTAGLYVYSANATQLGVNGSVIPLNLLAQFDETTPVLWPGTESGSAFNDGTFIRTVGGGDVLVIADIFALSDVFSLSLNITTGYYTIPDSHIINMGRLAPCLVQVIWSANGASAFGAGSDFFAPVDFFNQSDIFSSAANQLIQVYPEIAISTDGVTFGAFQKYAAGVYNIWKIKTRWKLQSLDSNTIAFLTAAKVIVYAPTRTDNLLVNTIIGAAGIALTFKPDGAASPSPFNGGPNGGAFPAVQCTIINQQSGDTPIITDVNGGTNPPTLSGCYLLLKNGGANVSRTVTLQAVGY